MGELRLIPKPSVEDQCAKEAIPMLENLLEKAKKGEIINLMIVFETSEDAAPSGRSVGCGCNSSFDFLRRLGALESLKFDWYKTLFEGAHD